MRSRVGVPQARGVFAREPKQAVEKCPLRTGFLPLGTVRGSEASPIGLPESLSGPVSSGLGSSVTAVSASFASSSRADQVPDSDQVVHGYCEDEHPPDAFPPSVPRLPHEPDRFHPPADLLDWISKARRRRSGGIDGRPVSAQSSAGVLDTRISNV